MLSEVSDAVLLLFQPEPGAAGPQSAGAASRRSELLENAYGEARERRRRERRTPDPQHRRLRCSSSPTTPHLAVF